MEPLNLGVMPSSGGRYASSHTISFTAITKNEDCEEMEISGSATVPLSINIPPINCDITYPNVVNEMATISGVVNTEYGTLPYTYQQSVSDCIEVARQSVSYETVYISGASECGEGYNSYVPKTVTTYYNKYREPTTRTILEPFTATTPMNCTDREQIYVDKQGRYEIRQNPGPCVSCKCKEYKYWIEVQRQIIFEKCGNVANGSDNQIKAYRQCTNPNKEKEDITTSVTFNISTSLPWINVRGNEITVEKNCTQSTRHGHISIGGRYTSEGKMITIQEVGSQITLNQGPCDEGCKCIEWDYSAYLDDSTLHFGACGDDESLKVTVSGVCTTPNSGEVKEITDFNVTLGDTSNILEFDDGTKVIKVLQNCTTSQRQTTVEPRVTFSGNTIFLRKITITQDAGKCDDCPKYYLQFTADNETIPSSGGSVTFTFYASTDTDGNDVYTGFSDSDFSLCNLSDCCQCSVTYDITPDEYGKFHVTYEYPPNRGNLYTNTWKVTCDKCEIPIQTLLITIYSPLDNYIPASDYFNFRYEWTDEDGTDLDSFTVINNDKIRLDDGTPLSKCAVGFFGYPYSSDGKITVTLTDGTEKTILRHGGDNRESGAEGAIVDWNALSKYAIDKGYLNPNDNIDVDIYGYWFIKKGEGDMTLKAIAYKAISDAKGIEQDFNLRNFSFNPGSNVKATWPNDDNQDSWENINSHVYATKGINGTNACVRNKSPFKIFTKLITLRYNIQNKITEIINYLDDQYQDNPYYIGYDNTNDIYTLIDSDDTPLDRITVPSSGSNLTFDSVLAATYNTETKRTLCARYITSAKTDSSKIEVMAISLANPSILNTTYEEIIAAEPKNLYYNEELVITNFQITENEDKSVKISMGIEPNNTSEERKFYVYFGGLNFQYGGTNCGNGLSTIEESPYITIIQNSN